MAAPDANRSALKTPFSRQTLVGRERDLDLLDRLVERGATRLVTIMGPGGTGKTRFASEYGARRAERFPGGVVFVPLAVVRHAGQVPSAILSPLAGEASPLTSELDAIVAAIGGRRTLLILDNIEHVIDAATFVAAMLTACPAVVVIATSRIALRISGEHEFPLAPLAIGLESPAVALFVERAQAVRAGFTLTYENAADIAEICQRLDGLPLAIELAAARTKIMAPKALLSRLTRSLSVLTGGPRDAPARLQSMREAIEWSYQLLDADQQRFFRQLSVFTGGFEIDMAGAVVESESDHFDAISSLVDQSLLTPIDDERAEPRFAMLETIREYAEEQLTAAGETEQVGERHARAFARFASERADEFLGPHERDALDRIDRDAGNLRTALEWLAEHDQSAAARMAYDVWFHWGVRGNYREGLDWLARLLPGGDTLAPVERARLHFAEGYLRWAIGQFDEALTAFAPAIAVFEAEGDEFMLAFARHGAGATHRSRGDSAEARAYLDLALPVFERLAKSALVAYTLSVLGSLHALDGRTTEAVEVLERGLSIATALHYPGAMVPIIGHLAELAREVGEYDRALDYHRIAFPVWQELNDPHGAADSLAGFAAALERIGDLEGAVRYFASAKSAYERIDVRRVAYSSAYQDDTIEALRSLLGEARFDELWQAGAGATLAESLSSAAQHHLERTETPAVSAVEASIGQAAGLTKREEEILEQLVLGKSNAEIGEALFISPRTAGTHVANIYAKLGVTSRAAAVAAVLRSRG